MVKSALRLGQLSAPKALNTERLKLTYWIPFKFASRCEPFHYWHRTLNVSQIPRWVGKWKIQKGANFLRRLGFPSIIRIQRASTIGGEVRRAELAKANHLALGVVFRLGRISTPPTTSGLHLLFLPDVAAIGFRFRHLSDR